MKRASKCIENKKEKYNANKIVRIFLSSVLKLGLAIALNFIFLLMFSTFALADGWTPSKPSHGTLYADTITSKTDGSPVNVADSLFVVDGITTLGSVGIGTTGPGAKLDVTGSVRINTGTGIFEIWDLGVQRAYIALTGTPGLGLYSDSEILFAPNNMEKVRIDGSGNVGIGTNMMDQALDVYKSGQGTSAIEIKSDQYTGWPGRGELGSLLFGVDGGGSGAPVVGEIQSMAQGDGGYSLLFRAYGSSLTDVMSVLGSGNVGIGTTSPLDKLAVAGNVGVGGAGFDNPGGASGQGIAFPSTSNDAHRIYGEHDGGDTSKLIIEQRDNTDDAVIFREVDCCGAGILDYMKIARNGIWYVGEGNVGIGTTSPNAKLDVVGGSYPIRISNAGGEPGLQIENTEASGRRFDIFVGSSGTYGLGTTHRGKLFIFDRTSSTDRIVVDTAGNVGIGTPSPNFKLEVAGSAGKPGGGSWSDSSDIRLKKNIKPIANALDKMLSLNGIAYQWKEPQKHGNLTGTYMGMIANDVEKSFPEWVGADKDGYKTLGFIGFEALTVESIRELKDKNDRKDKEIQELKSENEKLMKRLDILESRMKQK